MAPWNPARRWKPLRWRFSVLPPPPGSTLTSLHRRESADDLIFKGIKKKSSIGSSLLYLALISLTCCSPFSYLPRGFFSSPFISLSRCAFTCFLSVSQERLSCADAFLQGESHRGEVQSRRTRTTPPLLHITSSLESLNTGGSPSPSHTRAHTHTPMHACTYFHHIVSLY